MERPRLRARARTREFADCRSPRRATSGRVTRARAAAAAAVDGGDDGGGASRQVNRQLFSLQATVA